MRRILWELWLLPRNAALAFMHGYRRVISPLYGQVCRYYPSCSRYAVEALQMRGFLIGAALSAWRLLRCNPFSPGGIDDVPARPNPNFVINTRGFVRPIERKV
ncbi:membrane protein insertion efficiency factor YidD [Leucobacter luti]|uniref:membrane protein insertion efficiency factor YidD n=1 Tax=Leucobacter luti TaxID=340320 RepID=UPI003D069E71